MKRACLFVLVLFIIVAGCAGKDKVKLSGDSVTAQNAVSAVDAIREAY